MTPAFNVVRYHNVSHLTSALLYFSWADQGRRLFCIDHTVKKHQRTVLCAYLICTAFLSICASEVDDPA